MKPITIDIDKAAFQIISVGEKPDFIATCQDKAWIIDDHQSKVIKIAPDNKTPLLIISVPGAGTIPVVAFNALWVMSCTEAMLYKIDLENGSILAKIATGIADRNGEMSLAAGDGSIWLLSDSAGVLIRLDPATNSIQKRIEVKPHSYCIAFGHNAIWITNYPDNSVQRIDTKLNMVIATIPVGKKPRFLTTGEQGIWTLNQGDGTVSKIDPSTNTMSASVDTKAVGGGGDICAGAGKVWVVSMNTERPVQMIDQSSNTIEAIYTQEPINLNVHKVDGAVRISENYIWISGYFRKVIWVLKKKDIISRMK